MTRKRLFLSCVAPVFALLSTFECAEAAVVYNAVNDFSDVKGGASVWSYGYNALIATGTPKLLDQYLPGIFSGQVNGWHNTGGNCCGGGTANNSVLIGKNITAGTISYETIVQPTDYLSQDPESYASTDLIFTAKRTGSYAVSFGFLGIDTGVQNVNGIHTVDVLQNGVALKSGTIASYMDTYNGTFNTFLVAGQTLDFQTQTSLNTFANLSTGVQANVSLVPLPASAPMMGAALVVLGAAGYGAKRRKASGLA